MLGVTTLLTIQSADGTVSAEPTTAPTDAVSVASRLVADRSTAVLADDARRAMLAQVEFHSASFLRADVVEGVVEQAVEEPPPSPRELIAAGCPDHDDPELLRDGADADGRGLCERSVHQARTDASAAAIVAGFERLGLPYSRGRRGRDDYDDCSSFVGTSYRNAGFALSSTDWEPSSSVMRNAAWADVVDEPLPGDILWRRGHVAMALADGYQMHASQYGDVTHVRSIGRYSRVLAVDLDDLPAVVPAADGTDLTDGVFVTQP